MTSRDTKTFRESVLIIWDEATSGFALDWFDRLLREIMHNQDLPFGGKLLLVGGDRRQCLPVIPGADPSEILQSCLYNKKYNKNWDEFK